MFEISKKCPIFFPIAAVSVINFSPFFSIQFVKIDTSFVFVFLSFFAAMPQSNTIKLGLFFICTSSHSQWNNSWFWAVDSYQISNINYSNKMRSFKSTSDNIKLSFTTMRSVIFGWFTYPWIPMKNERSEINAQISSSLAVNERKKRGANNQKCNFIMLECNFHGTSLYLGV